MADLLLIGFIGGYVRGDLSPALPETDQALGAVLGGVEGALLASATIVILLTYATPGSTIGSLVDMAFLPDLAGNIDRSSIGRWLEQTMVPIVLIVLGPLLPSDITTYVPAAIPGGIPGFPMPSGDPNGFPYPLPSPTPTP